MATAKQIAARKLFVKRVRAGEFKRKVARKANPAKGKTGTRKTHVVNRWGTLIYVGDTVRAVLPRGGEITGVVTKIDKRSDFAKAYGVQITLDGSTTVGADDVVSVSDRMANPAKRKSTIKRTAVSARQYVKRPSQSTRAAPTKRLVTRRKKVTSGEAPAGYFPNPKKSAAPFAVQLERMRGWTTIATFFERARADQYAKAIYRTYDGKYAVRVVRLDAATYS